MDVGDDLRQRGEFRVRCVEASQELDCHSFRYGVEALHQLEIATTGEASVCEQMGYLPGRCGLAVEPGRVGTDRIKRADTGHDV